MVGWMDVIYALILKFGGALRWFSALRVGALKRAGRYLPAFGNNWNCMMMHRVEVLRFRLQHHRLDGPVMECVGFGDNASYWTT
jgi:hypothetical protein